jgi:DNA polymerase-1
VPETLADQAQAAIRAVREAPLIAFDTETSGLDWKSHQPIGYVITVDALNNWYIPVRHGGGGNLHDPNVQPLSGPTDRSPQHYFEGFLAAAFKERQAAGHLTVGHNVKFDMHMSANQGIILGRNVEDTGINEPMLDEYQRSYSLANCALRHGVTPKLGDALYEHISRSLGIPLPASKSRIMEHFWRLAGNDALAVDYALGDGITTLELHKVQRPLIVEQDMEFINGVESRLIYTLFKMERIGWKVDVEYLDTLRAAVLQELAAAKLLLPEGFNERSPVQTKAVMEAAGVTDWPTTDAGNPSFTEKFLKKSKQGQAIVALRKMSNLLSKFVDPLRTEHLHEGRVHASLNQLKSDDTGAIGGRLSCSDPNLQAVTKRDKILGPKFRRAFVADPGKVLYEKDYSQCEPCLFAHYSKEPALLDGYNADPPIDMHAIVAANFQVERDPTAKRMNMGILTGMQKRTFAEHMEWPLWQAGEAFDNWFRLFPGIRQFQDDAKAVMLDRGYVKTLCGRRSRMDSPRFAYKGVSKIIQGGNADIIKVKLLAIDRFIETLIPGTVDLIMTIHDSIIFQATDDEYGRAAAAEIHRIMTDLQTSPFNLRVPIRADGHSGYNWAVATYGLEAANKVLNV